MSTFTTWPLFFQILAVSGMIQFLWMVFVCFLVASLKEVNPVSWHCRFHNSAPVNPINKISTNVTQSCMYAGNLMSLPLLWVCVSVGYLIVGIGKWAFIPFLTGKFTDETVWQVLNSGPSQAPITFRKILSPSPVVWMVGFGVLLFWLQVARVLFFYTHQNTPTDIRVGRWVLFFAIPILAILLQANPKRRWYKALRLYLKEVWQLATNKLCREIPITRGPA